jgi:quercetin dioxygenase-like cupin family protein
MKSSKYTVTTTAQIVVPAKNYNREIYTHVIGNGIVYLGGSDVTIANGTSTEKHTAPTAFFVPAGETIYAIVESATEDLRVLDWTN